MTFRIYECDADGEHDTGKEFSCTIDDSIKQYGRHCTRILPYTVLMGAFATYGFTIPSGHNLAWDSGKELISGGIYWRNIDWRIKRVG